MAQAYEVLQLLIPNGGWVVTGQDYAGIEFLECEPITEAEFNAGFVMVDSAKADKDSKAKAEKAALLAKLGITADEAKLLFN
jgi:hypothetical protein